jgi:hypothetical protein
MHSAMQTDPLTAIALLVKDMSGLVNHTSRTPTQNTQTTTESPTHPSPSQIGHFLTYAEKELGVHGVPLYELPLRLKRYGPGILHKVPDSALEDLGIQPGDIIHLKDGFLLGGKVLMPRGRGMFLKGRHLMHHPQRVLLLMRGGLLMVEAVDFQDLLWSGVIHLKFWEKHSGIDVKRAKTGSQFLPAAPWLKREMMTPSIDCGNHAY